jgi:two-component system sensor histidine kinase and response regulator WspE
VSKPDTDDLSGRSMLELFRVEAENQTAILTGGLLSLERDPAAGQQWETLMRAAHSLKGAARIVNLRPAVQIAHALEDCFVAAQGGKVVIRQREVDLLLCAVDVFQQLAKHAEVDLANADSEDKDSISGLLDSLADLASSGVRPPDSSEPAAVPDDQSAGSSNQLVPSATAGSAPPDAYSQAIAPRRNELPERVVRLTAENLNRLLGLAGETLVESRWLRPFADSLQRLKRHQTDLSQKLDELRGRLRDEDVSEDAAQRVNELSLQAANCQQLLTDRMHELEVFDRRTSQLSQRLYLEVLRARMRPFADGTRRFPRMVRDLARSLGKEVRLEILGQNTQVDRDILERLETPIAHLLRNAVDHGCESREERYRADKPPEGVIRLEARHSAGMLLVSVTDDGAGVPLERVREAIVKRKLAMAPVAKTLSEPELLQFLFLPGFTLKETVTEISGRGVGLDVVQNMVKSVRGSIRMSTKPGRGMRVQLQLPQTLSVLRALLVEVAGEPYAIPLSRITRALRLERDRIRALEGRHHFSLGDQEIGLLTAHQVLECGPMPAHETLPVVVLGERNARYGLVVDRFLGERELVVQPLDPRLGKIQDISAAALMEDGSPIVILDVDDMAQSIERLVTGGTLAQVERYSPTLFPSKQKRVLAVDDSLTVRELERKLLAGRGYLAEVAVDGMDAWNALRTHSYDLVIVDVDMPRMDGIELTSLIKGDPRLKSLPVMIVSYKDREQDRMRGLEAGADYYLTKGSFQDETLLQAVVDLIGEPDE